MRTRHGIERTLTAMAHRIVKRFAPEKVILFGSHATGAAGADSDVDLLVVMPLTASKADHELDGAGNRPAPCERLRRGHDHVFGNAVSAQRRADLERTAARGGRLLYEKR
jgi:predicted nucleotidyltransferase